MEKIMIPPLDSNAAEVIKNNWAKMDKPLHSLGKLEEMVEKYAASLNSSELYAAYHKKRWQQTGYRPYGTHAP